MYESLYEPIANIDAYLERIKKERPDVQDKAYLDSLILAHQIQVSFENLDVWKCRKKISLGISDLYEKIVVQQRGGYCFELNGLFLVLLKQLGYEAYSCMCRITRGEGPVSMVSHRGTIVVIDGKKYFCDVGYGGPMPGGSVPVEDNTEISYCNEEYYVNKSGDYWWTLSRKRGNGELESIMEFYTMPQEPVDFIALNEYCSTNKDSIFRKIPFINRRTEKGNLSILDHTFTEVADKKVVQSREFTEEELPNLLKEYFQIQLQE